MDTHFDRFAVFGNKLYDFVTGWVVEFASHEEAEQAKREAEIRMVVCEVELGRLRNAWSKRCVNMVRGNVPVSSVVERANTELMA